ncbi:UNVERIFIED_CONTAM: hypothetical protein FKN15_006599 [Acipenser sinensis]
MIYMFSNQQFLFVVTFTTFLFNCVEYDILFANKAVNHTTQSGSSLERNKVTLTDAILPSQKCTERIQGNGWIIFLLIMAAIFWVYRLVKVFCNILSYWEIRQFYIKALKITMDELFSKYMNSFTSPLFTVIAKNVAFFSGSVLAVLIALTVYDEDVLTVQHILTAITILGVVVTVTRSFIPDEHMVWCPEQLLQCVLAHIHYMPDHWKGNASKSETRDEMAQLFQYKAIRAILRYSKISKLTVYDEDVLTVQHILTAITILGVVVTVTRSFIPDEHMVWCPEQLLQCVLAHIHYMPDHWKGNANKSETRDEMAQLFQYKAVFILEELLSPIVTPFILIFFLRHKSLEIIDFFRNFTVEVVGVGDICSFAQMDIRKHGNPQWLSEGQTEASVYQQAENGKTELSLMHFTIKNPCWQPPQESSFFISHLKEKVHHDAAGAPPAQHILSEAPLFSSLLSNESGTAPDNLLASVIAHPVLTASGLPGRDRRFVQPSTTLSTSQQPSRTRSHILLPSTYPENPMYRSDRTPDNLLASVIAHPVLTASGLPGRDRRFVQPSTTLSTSQQPSRTRSHILLPSTYPENPMYRSDRTVIEESMSGNDSCIRSINRSALLSEFALTEMSLHAIYMHEVSNRGQI